MKLTPEMLALNSDAADLASRLGWTVWVQSTLPRSRQGEPTMILRRGDRTLFVFLRSGRLRRDRLPDLETLALPSGAEVAVWHWPADRPLARGTLQ